MSAALSASSAPSVGASFPAGTVRRPRWRVLVNGSPLSGVEDLSVHDTNSYRASTFEATFAIAADPAMLTIWTDQAPPITVEVQGAMAGENGSVSWTSLFTGECDKVHVDLYGGKVSANGRDLARRFIDARTAETFANQTVSDIVRTLASRHGMTADVDDFDDLAGSFYQLEHDKLTGDSFSRQTTEWDLLTYLARHVGADMWVTGTVLHFKTAVAVTAQPNATLTWTPPGANAFPTSGDVLDLTCERNLTLAKDIVCKMRIWSSKGKSASTVSYPPSAPKSAQEYVLPCRPGMSLAAATAYVQAQYQDLVKHERLVNASMPGELTLTPRSVVGLQGTGSSFDTAYFVDEIDRSWGMSSGFRQTLRLKNHRTESDATVD